MQLLDSEWRRSATDTRGLWMMLHAAVRYPPLQLILEERLVGTEVVNIPGRRFSGLARFHKEEYLKLARLVQHLTTTVTVPATPESVLDSMVQFSQSLGRWLKVASGEKATCLEGTAVNSVGSRDSELLVEFGAFVGFSAVSVARRVPAARLLSCEIDPVHVAIARFVASMALPAADVNFLVGRAGDLMPVLVEDSGAHAIGFVFMDHSNTHFHEELRTLERLATGSTMTQVLADNVLKPGAPLFMWVASMSPAVGTFWALSEFRHDDQEDWMATVGTSAPRQHRERGRSIDVDRQLVRGVAKITDRTCAGDLDHDPFTWRWSWGVRHQKS